MLVSLFWKTLKLIQHKHKLLFLTRFFQRKTPVITMTNVAAGGWAIGRASVNILFPEHNSATVDKSAYLGFLITSSYTYLCLVSGLYLSNHLKYFNDTL